MVGKKRIELPTTEFLAIRFCFFHLQLFNVKQFQKLKITDGKRVIISPRTIKINWYSFPLKIEV
jgi:hypothetical protein